MLAVDTNVIVRYLTADDAAQFARACEVIEGQDVWVPLTVRLEAAWVTKSGGLLRLVIASGGVTKQSRSAEAVWIASLRSQ